jgi:hypothetical protein
MGCAYIMRTEIDGRFTNRINPQMVGGGRDLCLMEVLAAQSLRASARDRAVKETPCPSWNSIPELPTRHAELSYPTPKNRHGDGRIQIDQPMVEK